MSIESERGSFNEIIIPEEKVSQNKKKNDETSWKLGGSRYIATACINYEVKVQNFQHSKFDIEIFHQLNCKQWASCFSSCSSPFCSFSCSSTNTTLQKKIRSSSSSPSLANEIPHIKYDVFLSFKGEDTRNNFISHFYAVLHGKHIITFKDDQINKGDEILPTLLNVIEQSKIAVVIFSERYASSLWCLKELIKIIKCKREYGQIVIPIFYHVDPSDVRNQTGTFGDGFSKLEERFKGRLDKLQKWRDALREAANLCGFDFHNIRSESLLIEKIVGDILKRLNDMFSTDLDKDLVGLESRINEIESLLSNESIDIYTLGIWGIGGIGKTTIAGAIFNKISNYFDASCFMQNVREEFEKIGGSVQLRRELFSTLLGDGNLNISIPNSGFNFESKRISRKKVLIIFDDVTSSEQIKFLIGSLDWFMSGSLIIITTRNKQVLRNCGVKKIYKMKKLVNIDALKLFSWHAFKQNHPAVGYEELSNEIMQYAQGVPLAIKVLGRLLFGRSKREWESEIKKLKVVPPNDILKVLKVSYDGLDDKEKNIFLDIACFFKGKDKDLVAKFLDSSGFFAEIGLSILVDKCLIIILDNKITMHGLLQEMGKEIVRQESVNDPGKRSRLWHHNDIYKILTRNTGTEAIEGISLDMSKIKSIYLRPGTFTKMPNLRLLKFYSSLYEDNMPIQDMESSYEDNINKLHILDMGSRNEDNMIQDMELILMELRFLHWRGYPLKSLPSNIHMENLVLLELPNSKVEQLWGDVQNLANLKEIDLRGSKQLIKLPDLSKAQNLEKLHLEDCRSLVEIHSSNIQYLNKLEYLNLRDCRSLTSLPTSIHSESLKKLIIVGCLSLKRFPAISSCNMNELCLEKTGIEELPSSIDCLSRLVTLDLHDCSRLESLPSSIYNLESLQSLYLFGCSNLKRLPDISSCNIELLYLHGSGIEELPSSIEFLSRLVTLDLHDCSRLEQLPSSLCKLKSLQTLSLSDCSSLQRLPDELGDLKALKWLYAQRTAIREVPSSIVCLKKLEKLYFEGYRGCEQMSFILPLLLSSDGLRSLRSLTLIDCSITELPESLGQLSSLCELHLDKNNFERLPESIINLSELTLLNLSYCERLQSLPKLPCNLTHMDANHCVLLEALSGLSILFITGTSSNNFKSFCFRNCFKLDQDELRKLVEDDLRKIQLITAWELDQKYYLGAFGTIHFPGSEIPEWFKNQSVGSSINLELSPGDWLNNKFVVYVCCVIVAFGDHHGETKKAEFDVCCEWKFKTDDGDWHVATNFPSYVSIIGYVDSDHLILGYQSLPSMQGHDFGECGRNDKFCIQFDLHVSLTGELLECCKVKKCGIRLLYAKDLGAFTKYHGRSFSTAEEEADTCKQEVHCGKIVK